MQIWFAKGNNHGVYVSHGSDKYNAVSPLFNAFVCITGTTFPTESSSEYLLMRILKMKKLVVVFLIDMKYLNKPKQRVSRGDDLARQFVWCFVNISLP